VFHKSNGIVGSHCYKKVDHHRTSSDTGDLNCILLDSQLLGHDIVEVVCKIQALRSSLLQVCNIGLESNRGFNEYGCIWSNVVHDHPGTVPRPA
jgi:hypothetical protein